MTRGKHGSSAAQKRLAEAQERIASLEAQMRQSAEEHAVEVRNLKAQVQQLQGRLVSDVKRMAEERVVAAREQAATQTQSLDDAWRSRMKVVVRAGLTQGDPLWEDPQSVADASGLSAVEVVSLDPLARGLSRGIRRQFVSKSNRNKAFGALGEIASQGDWEARSER